MYLLFVALLQPVPVLFLLQGLALLLLWWRLRGRRPLIAWLAIPYLLLLAYCLPIVAYYAAGGLEWSFPPLTKRPPQAEAIVVLDGGIIPPTETIPRTQLSDSTLRRCLAAAELYHHGAPCPVVISGGQVDVSKPGGPAAEAMSDFLMRLGVPFADLVIEDQSTDTYENSVRCQQLLEQRGLTTLVLVTDATHLRRATRHFESRELAVIPAGSYYCTGEFQDLSVQDFLPQLRAAEINNRVFHELLGFLWDWLRGKQ